MSAPDFRELCQALAGDVQYLLDCIEQGAHDPASVEDCATDLDNALAALAAAPEGEPSDEDLCELAELLNGDPVLAMRRALELWGHPAAPPAPLEGEVGA